MTLVFLRPVRQVSWVLPLDSPVEVAVAYGTQPDRARWTSAPVRGSAAAGLTHRHCDAVLRDLAPGSRRLVRQRQTWWGCTVGAGRYCQHSRF